MLIYLFFIFTCGWCVCWLLFLNYQQHTRDNERILQEECYRDDEEYQQQQQHLCDESSPLSPSSSDQRDVEADHRGSIRRRYTQANQASRDNSQPVELLVDTSGEHRVLFPDEDLIHWPALSTDEAEIELLQQSQFNQLGLCENCHGPIQLQHYAPVEEEPPLMRGWPEDAQQAEDDDQDGPSNLLDGTNEELCDLWPIVELHENPMNQHETLIEARSGDDWLMGADDDGDEQTMLARSQMLSLSSQSGELLDKRAAIRLISDDSVQLLVAGSSASQSDQSSCCSDESANQIQAATRLRQAASNSSQMPRHSQLDAVEEVAVAARLADEDAKEDSKEDSKEEDDELLSNFAKQATRNEHRRQTDDGPLQKSPSDPLGKSIESPKCWDMPASPNEPKSEESSKVRRQIISSKQQPPPPLEEATKTSDSSCATFQVHRHSPPSDNKAPLADDKLQQVQQRHKQLLLQQLVRKRQTPPAAATAAPLPTLQQLQRQLQQRRSQQWTSPPLDADDLPAQQRLDLHANQTQQNTKTSQHQNNNSPALSQTCNNNSDYYSSQESQLHPDNIGPNSPDPSDLLQCLPVPSKRSNNNNNQPNHINQQLSITCPPASSPSPSPSIDMLASPAHSTPPTSVLSDSTTLITEAAMNSVELIPKLIQRLDRKLVVMKEEQLALMREIELNENTGQHLFKAMKHHLTKGECDKISLHATEIEKVTKLILSLKLRLKRVEAELKDRAKAQELDHQQNNPTSPSQSKSQIRCSPAFLAIKKTFEQVSPSQPQTTNIRGVSDPTSTTGLPKRHNHQHHASLQSPSSSSSTTAATSTTTTTTQQQNGSSSVDQLNRTTSGKAATLVNSGDGSTAAPSDSNETYDCRQTTATTTDVTKCNPERAFQTVNGSHAINQINDSQAAKGASSASASSDSIFNCADSAIGSTITGHGGSSTNIVGQHHHHHPNSQSNSTNSQSSLTSDVDSAESSTRGHHHHHHSKSPSQSHLSSNISVSSSHSGGSITSSVPNSPCLMSPTSTTCSGTPCASMDNQSSSSSSSSLRHQQQQQLAAAKIANSTSFKSSAPTTDDTNNSSTLRLLDISSSSLLTNDSRSDSMMHLLTDSDLLMAKRNKLVSQLEEAHQLEDCIIRRNETIVQRILKKYYNENEPHGHIAEFKQFTRLKSLLLKDSHDVADRIDQAELQLTELKQTQLQL